MHLSSAEALGVIRDAKEKGMKISVETCFHYLVLSPPAGSSSLTVSATADSTTTSSKLKSTVIPTSHCTEYKCCPPIRSKENQDRLWEALEEGLIDFVVSDHSPCVGELKKVDEGDVMSAWGGISTLGLGLSLLWTEGWGRYVGGDTSDSKTQKEREGELVKKVVRWLCEGTAKHAGLDSVKGKIQVGFDADFVVWDPESEFTVRFHLIVPLSSLFS